MSYKSKLGRLSIIAMAVGTIVFAGCSTVETTNKTATDVASASQTVVAMDESAKANALFQEIFMAGIMRSPVYQSYLGIKQDQDKWGDLSDANAIKEHAINQADLKKLQTLKVNKLDEQTKISLTLLKEQLQDNIDDFKYRFHNYPVNQMFGVHSMLPSLLINQHQIGDLADAKAYISRLEKVEVAFDQLIVELQVRENKGIMAPKFVYPYVINDSKNIITGAPYDDGEDSTLFADFKGKVAKLTIADSEKAALIAQAKQALTHQVKAGYSKLISHLTGMEQRANTDDGAWKLPNGKAYYENALKRTTTTDLTAKEIHEIGLKDVERIHNEMRDIMKKVGFNGDLQAFFEFMRTDKQFYYSEDEAGKQAYLDEATKLINDMKGNLDSLFLVKPKADLVVKAVEPFREQSAGKAFYERAPMDGSRPGLYYANLYKMSEMPSYQMAALAYHEGIPGHHMQISISQELEGIPMFRKFMSATAYVEGWGLYSELLPKEMGFYQDPYSDFGRLSMELWRACRLVVDTGIHDKRWTREQAIDYLALNTPNPKGDVIKAIERYIVMPSQATAYKVGMIKILALREKAKTAMKDKFDIREFHNVVLKNGPLPLSLLERFVDEYIESK